MTERVIAMALYLYDGPITGFNRCLANRWLGTTYAVSPQKARCNLAYRYKKQNNLLPNAKIELPGKIVMIEE